MTLENEKAIQLYFSVAFEPLLNSTQGTIRLVRFKEMSSLASSNRFMTCKMDRLFSRVYGVYDTRRCRQKWKAPLLTGGHFSRQATSFSDFEVR